MVAGLSFLASYGYFEGGGIGNLLNYWEQLGLFSYGTEDERYRCADIKRIVCEEYQSPQLSFKGFLPPGADSHIRLLKLLKEDIEK